MRQALVFLIIILAFTAFSFFSVNEISSLHQSLIAKPDTVRVVPQINDDRSYIVRYTTLEINREYEHEYLMDSLVIEITDSTKRSKINEIDKVIYKLYVYSSEWDYERFQTYTATKETGFAAKVKYPIRTWGSTVAYDNFVITALIYLKNGDIKLPLPNNH